FAISSFHPLSLSKALRVAIEFVGNYASWDFHPRPITCPSYKKSPELSNPGDSLSLHAARQSTGSRSTR
ncbi:MAG: hypothetical protein QM428_09115, partial [Verrucomicrobiota bacterium]|nr:hypothetical protein [Verrucomicrobiota bacterium]